MIYFCDNCQAYHDDDYILATENDEGNLVCEESEENNND